MTDIFVFAFTCTQKRGVVKNLQGVGLFDGPWFPLTVKLGLFTGYGQVRLEFRMALLLGSFGTIQVSFRTKLGLF